MSESSPEVIVQQVNRLRNGNNAQKTTGNVSIEFNVEENDNKIVEQ